MSGVDVARVQNAVRNNETIWTNKVQVNAFAS